MRNMRDKYLGLTRKNNQGYEMTIIEYNSCDDILVEFKEPYHCILNACTGNFIRGGIKNPNAPSVIGIGISGERYPVRIDGKITVEYQTCVNMLKRCNDSSRPRNHSYADVSVCNEWLYYDNFYEWYTSQPNYQTAEKMCLDKDILVKGNKIYEPNKCTLVPANVNLLFLMNKSRRGKYPTGVIKHKNVFLARYNQGVSGNQKHIGVYNTPEEAFLAYKTHKENFIKQVAKQEYNKGTITYQCYQAMMNYQINITD